MTYPDFANRAEEIVSDECEQATGKLYASIAARIRKECGKNVLVRQPQRHFAYAARSGRKVTNFPECDPTTSQVIMAVNVCVLEWKNGGVK